MSSLKYSVIEEKVNGLSAILPSLLMLTLILWTIIRHSFAIARKSFSYFLIIYSKLVSLLDLETISCSMSFIDCMYFVFTISILKLIFRWTFQAHLSLHYLQKPFFIALHLLLFESSRTWQGKWHVMLQIMQFVTNSPTFNSIFSISKRLCFIRTCDFSYPFSLVAFYS